MASTKITTDDATVVEQVRRAGELPVELNGVQLVLMTVDARRELQHVVYDDSEWSADEMMSVVGSRLDDPDGWGHPDMDVYDREYRHLFDDDDGKDL
jgi:hypothetical protein